MQGEERLSQEPLSYCAGLGANVQVGGAKTVEVSRHLPSNILQKEHEDDTTTERSATDS
jgi:hypothetical protein